MKLSERLWAWGVRHGELIVAAVVVLCVAAFAVGLAYAIDAREQEELSPAVRCRAKCTLSGMRVFAVEPSVGYCLCTELDPPTAGMGYHCREPEEKVWRLP